MSRTKFLADPRLLRALGGPLLLGALPGLRFGLGPTLRLGPSFLLALLATVAIMGPALYLLVGPDRRARLLSQLRGAFVDALAAAGRVHLGFAPAVLLLSATVAYREHAMFFALVGFAGGLLVGTRSALARAETRRDPQAHRRRSLSLVRRVRPHGRAAGLAICRRGCPRRKDRVNAMSTLPLDANPLSADTPTGPGGAIAYVDEPLKYPALVGAEPVDPRSRSDGAGADLRPGADRGHGDVRRGAGFLSRRRADPVRGRKLPLVTLVMLATVAPLLHALNRALERPANMAREVDVADRGAGARRAGARRRDAAHLGRACRGSRLSPHDSHHRPHLCGGGFVSFWFLWGGLSATRQSRWLVALIVLTTVGIVGTQATWLFRPYLVRPARGRRRFHAPARRLVLGGAGGQHRFGARALSRALPRARHQCCGRARDDRARVHVGAPRPLRDGRRRLRRWRPERGRPVSVGASRLRPRAVAIVAAAVAGRAEAGDGLARRGGRHVGGAPGDRIAADGAGPGAGLAPGAAAPRRGAVDASPPSWPMYPRASRSSTTCSPGRRSIWTRRPPASRRAGAQPAATSAEALASAALRVQNIERLRDLRARFVSRGRRDQRASVAAGDPGRGGPLRRRGGRRHARPPARAPGAG